MKWFSFTMVKGKLRTMIGGHPIWVWRLPDSFQEGLSIKLILKHQSIAWLSKSFANAFIRQNAIKWIGSTFRAFSILWTRLYFCHKRIETHWWERRLPYQNLKKEGTIHEVVLCNNFDVVVGMVKQFLHIRIQYS
jgi:hypothetical protein